MKTRISLLLLITISLLSLANTAGSAGMVEITSAAFVPQGVRFLEFASGFDQPIFITNAGDGSGRLFIIERAGLIRIYKNGALLSTPFLDIQSIVKSTGGEQGLLALAFHPNYESNGQFYTVHTNSSDSLVLSRFTRSAANPDLADANSRISLLTIGHPTNQNHNGGTLAFGPDGYLYWSTGDGGGGGDPSNNAQNLNSLLGKILRLDIDAGSPYAIPSSNPYFNNPSPSIRKEIWSYGLRNPWRFSFDRQTGDIFIGDVGQGAREEVNFQPANDSGGKNYGWRVMEGSLCYNPSSGCDQSGKVLPIAEYDHSMGCSISGGYIYRGTAYPQMDGYYFYGDFCSGIVNTLHNETPNGWSSQLVSDTSYSISTFGEDEQGELYFADYGTGIIYQISYIPPPAKATLASPFGDINTNYNPTYTWNEVSDATWYYLWVNGPSGNVIKQWYTSAQADCDGSTCSVTPSTTLSGGAHTWWIQTWNLGGYGPWSDGMNFETYLIPAPGSATPISPTGDIGTNYSPSFNWNEVSGASWYYLWISNSPSSKVHNKWYEASAICSAGTCTVPSPVTLGGGNYNWWVQTWNSTGYGPWSSGVTFSTAVPTPPSAATLSSPTGNIGTNYSASFTWSEVSGATWYYLWINGPSSKILDKWYEASAICSAGTCTASSPVTLGGGNHAWWVQTWNSGGYGPWSSGMTFYTTVPTPPPAATLTSPTGDIGSDHSPSFTWNQVSGANWYYLWINDGPSSKVFDKWYEASAICNAGICTVPDPVTLGSGNYAWWVQTWNSAGHGPWSGGFNFSIQ
jgi:glucose/arabinose dehydrogenase